MRRRRVDSFVPVRPYLLRLSEEPLGAAVVDVHFAQALEWGSHGNVWGREGGQFTLSTMGPVSPQPCAPGRRVQHETDLTLPGRAS